MIPLNDLLEKAKLEGGEHNCGCQGGGEGELDYKGAAQENLVGG